MKGLASVSIVCALLLCQLVPSQAEDIIVNTDGSKPGVYYLKLVVNSDGSSSVTPLSRVVKLGNPLPTDPVVPPVPGGQFQQEIKILTQQALSKGGTKTTGAALSSVYSLVADGIGDGSITVANAQQLLQTGINLILNKQADAASWTVWKESVNGLLNKLAQDGSLATKAQYISIFREISAGMNQATGFAPAHQSRVDKLAPNQGILDGIDIGKVIELIKLILELFKLFKP